MASSRSIRHAEENISKKDIRKINNFLIRSITTAVIIIATIFILYFSGNDMFIRLVAAVFASFSVYEFFNVTDTMEHEGFFVLMMIAAVVLPFVRIPYYKTVLAKFQSKKQDF